MTGRGRLVCNGVLLVLARVGAQAFAVARYAQAGHIHVRAFRWRQVVRRVGSLRDAGVGGLWRLVFRALRNCDTESLWSSG